MKKESILPNLLRMANVTIYTCSLCMLSGCALDFDLFDEDKIPACKNDCTIIKGKFLTDGGTTPIPNVTLQLAWSDPCLGCFFGSGDRDIATTTTDDHGNYEFKFASTDHELKYGYYDVSFDHPGLPYYDFSYGNGFGVTVNAKGTTTEYDYILPKIGQLQLTITNHNDVGDGEYLNIARYFWYGDGSKREFVWCLYSYDYTSCTCDAALNQYTYLWIKKMKDGVESHFIDSVFVSSQSISKYEATF